MSKPVLALGLALLAFAAYATTLANGFVWDDPIILTRQLPVFRNTSVWLPPRNVPQFAVDYYRPLVIASYLVDQNLGQGSAWPFHLTVVLAHVLATVAVFALGLALLRRVPAIAAAGGSGTALLSESTATSAAAIGAALFAVHPVHVEAVAWMAGRADVFAGLFGVTAAWAHLAARRSSLFALLSGVAVLLALLSKEVSISLLALLPLLDWMVPEVALAPAASAPRAKRRSAPAANRPAAPPILVRYAAMALALLVYGGLRLAAGGGLSRETTEPIGFLPARLLAALGVYLFKMIIPVSLNAYIAELPDGIAVLLGGAVAIAIYGYSTWHEWRAGRAAVAFLLLWFLVALAPSLSILVKIPEVPLAERYLYLPSAGLCLAVGFAAAVAIERRGTLRNAALAGTAIVLAVFLAATIMRGRVWSSDAALWADTAAKNPRAIMPLQSFGDTLVRANRLDEAEQAYREALQRKGSAQARAATLSNLGMIALTRGSMDQAEQYYREALAVQVTPQALYSVGVIGLRRVDAAGDEPAKQRYALAALGDLERAEQMSPLDANLQLALGHALSVLGRRPEARPHYERALSLGLAPEIARQVQAALAQP